MANNYIEIPNSLNPVIAYNGPGKPFIPTQISGLKLWLKSDLGTFQNTAGTIPAVANNDPIALWKDQSGNGNDYSQSTGANRPIINTAVLAGKTVVGFNGTNTELLRANTSIFNNISSAYVCVVYQTTAPGTDIRPLYFSVNGSNTVKIAMTRELTGANKFGFRGKILDTDAAVNVEGGTFVAGTWNNQEIIYDCTNNLASILMDGIPITSGSMGTAGNTTNANSSFSSVGSANGSVFINGQIAEILIYVPKLSISNQALVETYLRTRWNTP